MRTPADTSRVLSLIVFLAAAWPAPAAAAAAAQESNWGVGVEVGLTRFWGGSRSTDSAALSGRPYRPTTVGLRIDRRMGEARIALGLQYASSGFAIEAADAAYVSKGSFTWLEATPEIDLRLGTIGPIAELRLFGGPKFDVWTVAGESARVRLGGQAGLAVELPLGRRVSSTLRLRGGLGGSVFDPDEVPPNFERRVMPQVGLTFGLRWGL